MGNIISLRTPPVEVLPPVHIADESQQSPVVLMLANEEWMQAKWEQLLVAWLDAKHQRSNSAHTCRNYLRIVNQWRAFIDAQGVRLWQVEARHVRAWQRYLLEDGRQDENARTKRGSGVRDVTVNGYMSAVSSYYTFVINEKFLIQGRELCLFVDSTGYPRANPFRYGNVARLRTEDYDRAAPLEANDLARLVLYLEEKSTTLSGARNHALIVTFLLTGYRNAETLRMRWGDLRPSRSQRGVYIYSWEGKGNKKADEAFPRDAWEAIKHYLALDGRWRQGYEDDQQPGMQKDDYIFRATVRHTYAHLRNVRPEARDVNEPISEKSAVRILRTALRRCGVKNPELYRVHDIRHTFARLMLDEGATETEIMQMLHQANLSVTSRYTKAIRRKTEDPVDVRSQRLYQRMRSGKAE